MILAIDIGGTFFRYKFDDIYEKIETKNIDIIKKILELIDKFSPKAVGISFAGQVNDGVILSSPNIKISETDLKKIIKIPFILENDLNCAALAESKFYNEKYLIALYSGTGLGIGIIENGKIIKGYMNLAGEIGHMPYKETPFICKCGKNNCLEFFASGSGIEKWKSLGIDILKDKYIKALLFAIGTINSLFNPKIIVLGGGVIIHNLWIVDELKKNLKKYVPNFDKFELKITKLKDASLNGAEILAKELL